jgi:hypothetical protein
MNKFNIFDIVKIKGETDIYKVFAIQYYHDKGIEYELWRTTDFLELIIIRNGNKSYIEIILTERKNNE